MNWFQVLKDMKNLYNYVEKMQIPEGRKEKILGRIYIEIDNIKKQADLDFNKNK